MSTRCSAGDNTEDLAALISAHTAGLAVLREDLMSHGPLIQPGRLLATTRVLRASWHLLHTQSVPRPHCAESRAPRALRTSVTPTVPYPPTVSVPLCFTGRKGNL